MAPQPSFDRYPAEDPILRSIESQRLDEHVAIADEDPILPSHSLIEHVTMADSVLDAEYAMVPQSFLNRILEIPEDPVLRNIEPQCLDVQSHILATHVTIADHEDPVLPSIELQRLDVQSLPLANTPPTPQDWEAYRHIFTQLYSLDNKPLKEVQRIMAEQYQFHATERMYKRRINNWKLNKNYKADEKKEVVCIIKQCKKARQPCPTILHMGRPVKIHKVRRHYRLGSLSPVPQMVQPTGSISCDYGSRSVETSLSDFEVSTGGIQNYIALSSDPGRLLATPAELRQAELLLLQVTHLYDLYFEYMAFQRQKAYGWKDEEKKAILYQDTFMEELSVGMSCLDLGQSKPAWRLLDSALDKAGPMLAAEDPFTFQCILYLFVLPFSIKYTDILRVVWDHITNMSSTILGEKHPLSVIFQTITRIDTSSKVFEVANRRVYDMFEQGCGPGDSRTLCARGWYQTWIIENGVRDKSLQEAIYLQHLWMRDCEHLLGMQNIVVVREFLRLGKLLQHQGDFSGAEKMFRDALQRSKNSIEDNPGAAYIPAIVSLVSILWDRREFGEIERILKEVLERFLGRKKLETSNWYMVEILGLLDEILRYESKYGEADELRLQYPDAF